MWACSGPQSLSRSRGTCCSLCASCRACGLPRLKTAHLPRALLQQSVGQGTSSMGGRVVVAKLLLLWLLGLVEAPVLLLLRWPLLQRLLRQQ